MPGPTPTQTLDIKGLQCPMPLSWAKMQIDRLKPGDVLEVLATDPATLSNFEAFSRATGHRLVETSEADGVLRLLLQKAGGPK